MTEPQYSSQAIAFLALFQALRTRDDQPESLEAVADGKPGRLPDHANKYALHELRKRANDVLHADGRRALLLKDAERVILRYLLVLRAHQNLASPERPR